MHYIFSRKIMIIMLASLLVAGCSNYKVVTPKRAQSAAERKQPSVPVASKGGVEKVFEKKQDSVKLEDNLKDPIAKTEEVEWQADGPSKKKIANRTRPGKVNTGDIRWKNPADDDMSSSLYPDDKGEALPGSDSEFPPLVVTDSPPPNVIYRSGSRDTVLMDEQQNEQLRKDTYLEDQKVETAVTAKARELYRDMKEAERKLDIASRKYETLRTKSNDQITEYYSLVANISAALRSGTTPGNPILVDRWNAAQSKLNDLPKNINMINNLAVDLSGQASKAAFILESVESAFNISGAVDADHRMLRKIEDRSDQIVTDLNRMIMQVNKEMNRIDALLKTERANMQTLSLGIARGELYGESLANSMQQKTMDEMAKIQPPETRKRKPLVIIRFDKPNVDYERPLYKAVSTALDKYPSARFSIMTVSPESDNKAKESIDKKEARNKGEEVMDALIKMGLPSSRVSIETSTSDKATSAEIHIFLK